MKNATAKKVLPERRGVVKSYFQEKRFGFIIPDEGGPDVFYHIEMCDKSHAGKGRIPCVGEHVVFEQTFSNQTGRFRTVWFNYTESVKPLSTTPLNAGLHRMLGVTPQTLEENRVPVIIAGSNHNGGKRKRRRHPPDGQRRDHFMRRAR